MIVDDNVDIQESAEPASLAQPEVSRTESIAVLSAAVAVLENRAEKWDNEIGKGIQVLRKIQKELEQEERSEREHKLQQTPITSYFKAL
jgi:hypothetical protein